MHRTITCWTHAGAGIFGFSWQRALEYLPKRGVNHRSLDPRRPRIAVVAKSISAGNRHAVLSKDIDVNRNVSILDVEQLRLIVPGSWCSVYERLGKCSTLKKVSAGVLHFFLRPLYLAAVITSSRFSAFYNGDQSSDSKKKNLVARYFKLFQLMTK